MFTNPPKETHLRPLVRLEPWTFEDYCRERWGMKRNRAYQLMRTATVFENVSNLIQTSTREAHMEPLTKLEPEKQKEVWKEAVKTAPNGQGG